MELFYPPSFVPCTLHCLRLEYPWAPDVNRWSFQPIRVNIFITFNIHCCCLSFLKYVFKIEQITLYCIENAKRKILMLLWPDAVQYVLTQRMWINVTWCIVHHGVLPERVRDIFSYVKPCDASWCEAMWRFVMWNHVMLRVVKPCDASCCEAIKWFVIGGHEIFCDVEPWDVLWWEIARCCVMWSHEVFSHIEPWDVLWCEPWDVLWYEGIRIFCVWSREMFCDMNLLEVFFKVIWSH